MKRLHFEKVINAPANRVWDVLWTSETYTQWTNVFCEGSYAVSNWNQGGKILFLTPEGEGMSSIIAEKEDNRIMAFRHIAMVKDGIEQPVDDATASWSGAMEIYTLIEDRGKTTLSVEMDIVEDHQAYFLEVFPKGLERVADLSEA